MLVLDRVGKTYPNGVRALEGVSLNVEPGEIVAVVGGSGCGKSTMLRAISGLDTPTQGVVKLDGDKITEPHEKIGVIFQEPRLLPWLTVAENIGFGIAHLPKQEREQRVGIRSASRVHVHESECGGQDGAGTHASRCAETALRPLLQDGHRAPR